MKKSILIGLLLLPFMGTAQTFQSDSIPVVDGKVVFKAEFKADLTKEEFHKKARTYLNEKLNPYSGAFRIDNNDFTVSRITDYVSIENSLFQKFGMYMTYDLQLGYKDGVCIMVINRIRYIDKGNFEAHEKDPRHNRIGREWTGKEIMIDRRYSLMFIKHVSERITEVTLKRINGIIKGLDAAFGKNKAFNNG